MSATDAFNAIYALAALAGLVAGVYWLRVVSAHATQAKQGDQPTWKHLSEAAVTTGIALLLASGTFLLSLL